MTFIVILKLILFQKSDQVSSALINNDTLIYTDGIEATNETQVAEIADPARPIV